MMLLAQVFTGLFYGGQCCETINRFLGYYLQFPTDARCAINSNAAYATCYAHAVEIR